MAKAKSAVPEGLHTITPQLTLDNAAQAIDWYKKALGAEEVSRAAGPDGKIMHAELRIGDSRIMVNDAMMGGKGPKALGGSPASLWIYVEDCDALFNRAVAAGGQVAHGAMGSMQDQFWGDRSGTLHRSARLPLDDRDTQGRSDAAGNAAAAGGVDEAVRRTARKPVAGTASPIPPARRSSTQRADPASETSARRLALTANVFHRATGHKEPLRGGSGSCRITC